jgi:hypothetical protein
LVFLWQIHICSKFMLLCFVICFGFPETKLFTMVSSQMPPSLLKTSKRISLEHYSTWNTISNLVRELWSPPPIDSLKVNFDSYWRPLLCPSSCAYLTNSKGIIKAISQFRPPCDPTYGEAQAALFGCFLGSFFASREIHFRRRLLYCYLSFIAS